MTPQPRHKWLALVVVGWTLLTLFVLVTVRLGSINYASRTYQAAYLLGFSGYVLLLLYIRVHSGDPLTFAVPRRLKPAAQRHFRIAPGRLAMRKQPRDVSSSWKWWFGGCLILRLGLIGTQPGDDVYRYVWEGRIQLAGFNPYQHPPDDPALAELRNMDWQRISHPHFPAIYPPLAQWSFILVAAIYPSVYMCKFLYLLCDAGVILVLASILRCLGKPLLGAIIYGLCPLTLSAFAVEGHLDSLMLLFAVMAIYFDFVNRPYFAGVMLGLAIASKVVVAILIVWFIMKQWKTAATATLVVGLAYLPHLLAGHSGAANLIRFGEMDTLFSLLPTLGIPLHDTDWGRLVVLLMFGGTLVIQALRSPKLIHYATFSIGLLLMLLPMVHLWYLTWIVMMMALRFQYRWITASGAAVVYFEAAHNQSLSGIWAMPPWAPRVFWFIFLLAWLLEFMAHRFDESALQKRNVNEVTSGWSERRLPENPSSACRPEFFGRS